MKVKNDITGEMIELEDAATVRFELFAHFSPTGLMLIDKNDYIEFTILKHFREDENGKILKDKNGEKVVGNLKDSAEYRTIVAKLEHDLAAVLAALEKMRTNANSLKK